MFTTIFVVAIRQALVVFSAPGPDAVAKAALAVIASAARFAR